MSQNKISQSEYNSEENRDLIMKPLFARPVNKKCSWCEEELLLHQPISKSYDGEEMHFNCAAECDDSDIGDSSN